LQGTVLLFMYTVDQVMVPIASCLLKSSVNSEILYTMSSLYLLKTLLSSPWFEPVMRTRQWNMSRGISSCLYLCCCCFSLSLSVPEMSSNYLLQLFTELLVNIMIQVLDSDRSNSFGNLYIFTELPINWECVWIWCSYKLFVSLGIFDHCC